MIVYEYPSNHEYEVRKGDCEMKMDPKLIEILAHFQDFDFFVKNSRKS